MSREDSVDQAENKDLKIESKETTRPQDELVETVRQLGTSGASSMMRDMVEGPSGNDLESEDDGPDATFLKAAYKAEKSDNSDSSYEKMSASLKGEGVVEAGKDKFYGFKGDPEKDAAHLATLLLPEDKKIDTATILYTLDKYAKNPEMMAKLLKELREKGFDVTEKTENGVTTYEFKTGRQVDLLKVTYDKSTGIRNIQVGTVYGK